MSSSVCKVEPELSESFLQEIMDRSGQNLLACYQCRRCASGCPVGEESGVTPDRLIRMVVLGEKEEALNNLLVWKCLSCYTCGTRCPNNIHTSRITETLKQMSKEAHLAPLAPKIAEFHRAFMVSTSHFGRFDELAGMGIYMRKSLAGFRREGWKSIIREMKKQAKIGASMMKKKRIHFGFERIKGLPEVKRLYKRAKEVKAR